MKTDILKYKDISFKNIRSISKIQEILLREHFEYCITNSPFYRKVFKRSGSNFKSISMNNLSEFPLTEKSDIEKNNDAFCAVDKKEIVDIVLSSGTTGEPIKVMYTDRDLKRLAYNEAKSFEGCGLNSKDIVLLTCTMDRCFIAGLAYFLGVRDLGAAAIRNGHGSLESHAGIIDNIKPTTIIGVPTFLRKLGSSMLKNGNDPRKTSVKKLICIGEPLRDKDLKPLKICDDIEKIWGAKAFSTYASSETITTFCECKAQLGGHLHPDLAIIEIIDDKGHVLPYGEKGEIVITPLGIEAMPLIRYKTGDISFIVAEPCSCGRNSLRIGPIIGRKKQMMKIKGTTLYPQAVFSALENLKGISEYYIEVRKESDLSDDLIVHAAVNDDSYTEGSMSYELQSHLRVKPKVIIEDESVIRKQVFTQESRKPIRFIDRR